MPNTVPIQTSFAGGELSPKLRGRVETDLYKKAVAYDENWEPLATGPVITKAGTRFARLLSGFNEKSRLFAFPRQGGVGYIIAMGGGKLRLLNGDSSVAFPYGGEPVQLGAIDWLRNATFRDGWNYWHPWSRVLVSQPPLYSTNGEVLGVWNHQYLLIHPTNFLLAGITQTIETIPAGTYKLRVTYATAAGGSVRVNINSGPLFISGEDHSHSDPAADIFTTLLPGTPSLADTATLEFDVTVPGPGNTPISIDLHSGSDKIETFHDLKVLVWLKEVALRSTGTGDATWDTGTTPAMPWTDDQLAEVQIVAEPARDRVMFFHPDVAPHELSFDSSTTPPAWTFGVLSFDLGAPPYPWGSGKYPAAAELYQGRLIVGGIPGKENTILGSRSGEPLSFTEAAEPSAADYFSLDVSTKGTIRWLEGQRTLLIGTDKGEMTLTAQGGVVTPSDFEVRAQSGYGSAAIQAVQLGDRVLYTSRDRRRLRMLSYNQQENGWQTNDLTFTSEHLTEGGIREVHWLSSGNDKVLAVTHNGEVRCWTYNKPEGVIAPWRANFGGKVWSIAIIDVGDEDRVWMLVQRPGGVTLEHWELSMLDSNPVLLDSYVRTSVVDGAVTGLDHLEGSSVVPIVDGVIQATQTVTSGAITATGTTCIAGLWNPPTLTTLPKEGGNPAGTAAGAKQRPVKLSLRLNDSALPLVNGERAGADRHPSTPMDTTEPRFTEDVTVRVLGWEDGGAVTITQDVPIRTEILAIYGIVATREVTG